MYSLGSMVFGIVMPYLYNPDAAALGSKTGFVYFRLSGLAFVVSWFILPEMKGRSSKEIERMFDLRLLTRKFKHWAGDEDGA